MKAAKFYFTNKVTKEWACDDVETFQTHIVVRRMKAKSEIVIESINVYEAIAVVSMVNLLWWEPK